MVCIKLTFLQVLEVVCSSWVCGKMCTGYMQILHILQKDLECIVCCTQSGPRSGSHSVLEVTMLSVYMCSIVKSDFVLQGGILNLVY